jgi:hypothetical protein
MAQSQSMQRHRGVKGNLVFCQALPPKNPMVGCLGRWRRAAGGHVAADKVIE